MNELSKANARTSRSAIFTICSWILLLSGCLSGGPGSKVENETSGVGGQGDVNQVPTIFGDPPGAALVGEAYDFAPTAFDPDGDDLLFSIEGKPSWAIFDSQTGSLSGVPTIANIGIVSDIRISVSDSQSTVSMPYFSVEVVQSAPGSITLSWIPPTENEDGSALTNLAGYKLFYGRASGEYTNVIQIDNPSISTYVVENLVPATYYFVATSYNVPGTESRFSGEAVHIVN